MRYRGICHASLVFLCIRTHEPLGDCVFEENTTNKWHVPQYPTRKYCITTSSHAYIFGKLTAIFGRFWKSSEFLKTSERFKTVFEEFLRFMKILKVFGNLRKTCGCDRNCSVRLKRSQELKSIGVDMGEFSKGHQHICCSQVMA